MNWQRDRQTSIATQTRHVADGHTDVRTFKDVVCPAPVCRNQRCCDNGEQHINGSDHTVGVNQVRL